MTQTETNDKAISQTEKNGKTKRDLAKQKQPKDRTRFRKFPQKAQSNITGDLNQAENAETQIRMWSSKLRRVTQKPFSEKRPVDAAGIIIGKTLRNLIRPYCYKFDKLGQPR